MSSFRMKSESADSSRNISITEPANSSSIMEKKDSSKIGYLIEQCETLMKNNFSKYDICIKYQEKLRLQLIKAKEDYKYLRVWLESVNEDYFRMECNDGHLTRIYEMLLENNFVNDYLEYGVSRERLNLKFLRTMMQVKDLRKDLSAADGDVTSVKSDYEEMQYREVLMQIISAEESLEYAEFENELRLKSSDIIHKCEYLSISLSGACEDIIELESKHNDLTRCYDLLLKNATVKELLSYAKHRVELLPELPEKPNTKKIQIKQTENESSSVDDFSDKSYNLLQNLPLILQDEMGEKFATNDQSTQTSSVEIHSAHSTSNTVIDFFAPCTSEMGFSQLKETDSSENVAPINVRLKECEEELIAEKQRRELIEEKCKSLDKFSDKLCHLLQKYQHSMSKDENLNVSLDYYHSESYFDNYGSCAKTYTADDLVEKNYPGRNEKRDSIVENQPSSSSSSQAELPETPISTSMSRKRKQTTNRLFYCKKCDKSFLLKKNQLKPKCPTCGARKNTIISKETKPTINRPITRSNSVAANSAVSDFLCNICDRYYSNKTNLNVHKRLVHEDRKEFKCSVCGKLLKTKHNLETHAATHSSLKPYQCPICIQCFSHPDFLRRHVRKRHPKRWDSLKQHLKFSSRGSERLRKKKCPQKRVSNQAELSPSSTQKSPSATKVSYDSKLKCSLVLPSSTNSENFIEKSPEETKNEWFYCPKCQKLFATKKNEPILKCPTCSIRDNTIDLMATNKSMTDDPTSQITNNNPTVENSSKLSMVSE